MPSRYIVTILGRNFLLKKVVENQGELERRNELTLVTITTTDVRLTVALIYRGNNPGVSFRRPMMRVNLEPGTSFRLPSQDTLPVQ